LAAMRLVGLFEGSGDVSGDGSAMAKGLY